MLKIIFTTHATTFDNEAKKASGWYDVDLSPLGLQRAKERGEYYKNVDFDAVYCSDLKRSYKTAEIAFKDRNNIKIIKDKRLRECDYGDLTRMSLKLVNDEKLKRISVPFPNGESYEDCVKRMKDFLIDILKNYKNGSVIMIIGHRATQYGLNHLIKGWTLTDCINEDWKWQPGWEYELNDL